MPARRRWKQSRIVARGRRIEVPVRIDPARNLKIDRQHSFEKVDGLVAAAMAVGRAMKREKIPDTTSVYESRGLLSL